MEINLKQIRVAKGYSQETMARLTGLSLGGYRNHESGATKSISYDILNKFCDVLQCDVSDILVRTKS